MPVRKTPSGGAPRPSRQRALQIAFTPDPRSLLLGLERATTLSDIGPIPPSQVALHVFRLLRPEDLVVLDVQASGMELQVDGEGAALVPVGADARLRVRFAFQHVGERAFFEPGPAPTIGDARALAAQSTRLVYDVPANERIEYTQAGVLAALSRLPLRVAPLATKAPIAPRPGFGRVGELLALPGGFLLGRMDDGRLAMTRGAAAAIGRRNDRRGPSARDVISSAMAVRTARTMLSREVALDYTSAISTTGLGDLVIRPDRLPPMRPVRPRPPLLDETAIEAPFRLILSPSALGGFAHSPEPVRAPTDPTRVELWHTRLGVRTEEAESETITINEQRNPERIVRAIWARDKQELPDVNGVADMDAPANADGPFPMSLKPAERIAIVRQSADPRLAQPTPISVDKLALTSLGAILDLHGLWPNFAVYQTAQKFTISRWDHEAILGRDQFVRVDRPGYLFPFGHKCVLVTITERKLKDATKPIAWLYKRQFIALTEPTRVYADRRMPFREITLRPMQTPDLEKTNVVNAFVKIPDQLFWPTVAGSKFAFTVNALDRNGDRVRVQAPLLFVDGSLGTPPQRQTIKDFYAIDRVIPARSQAIAFAEGEVPGDTLLETMSLTFDGEPGTPGANTSTPWLFEAQAIVPAMRHLSPSAPPQTIRFHDAYLANGFGGANAQAQRFVALPAKPSVSFATGTDRAGGFLQPDIPVHALSRLLGAVDDGPALASGTFDPSQFLSGIPAKLFGLFPLTDILQAVGLDAAPRFITEQLDRIAALLADLESLRRTVQDGIDRLGDDAINGATAALRQQAQAAKDALQAVIADLTTRVGELNTALTSLLSLGTETTTADVENAVGAALDALRGLLATVRAAVRAHPLPPVVRAPLERLLDALEPALAAGDAINATIDAIRQFVEGLDPAGAGVRAKFDWRPALKSWPNEAKPLLKLKKDSLLLSVDARASGSSGVGVDVLAELRSFSLRLFPDEPLMALHFERLAFRAASGRKPEVDVVFTGIEFLGILSFIETLKDLIPFDGFSDPPYLDVSAEGVKAGFDLSLPSTAIGVFSLENISFGADARVPFIGSEALTVGFNFCSREKPFRLTVMMIGGGGFVGIRLSPKGLVVLEMALEAGASLSLNFGVASGSVSVMIGVYLKLESDAGSLTGYFRVRGEVDVLGLISASITLELALRYEFASGKMVGRASIEIEVDVFLLSFSVTVTCERRLAGSNGDPTFGDLLGVLPDGSAPAWTQYCAAFAEA